jgi:hypothetical protein
MTVTAYGMGLQVNMVVAIALLLMQSWLTPYLPGHIGTQNYHTVQGP